MSPPPTYPEPAQKRAIAFIDGQNLFHCARECFGYTVPNYEAMALTRTICAARGWNVSAVHFYTGIPAATDDARWNSFWSKKLLSMNRRGIKTYSRPLRYRDRTIGLPGGNSYTYRDGEEKGIDVRIALDIIRKAHRQEYDVALVFSQDQDLSEVADELRAMAREQKRWIKMASAFPHSAKSLNARGINGTDWIEISRDTYDACLDPYDYFGPPNKQP